MIQGQPDGRDAEGRYEGKGWSFHALLERDIFPDLHVFTNQKLSELCHFQILWRLCYIGIIDKIIGHW